MPKLLTIAVNDYPELNRQLRGCVNDSIAWSNWFQTRGWEIETLWNEEASGTKIRSAIRRLMQEAPAGGRVAIHFSGHGSQIIDSSGDEKDQLDECYCPWDVLEHGPLLDDELYRLFQLRRPDVRLYLIADCCHSGSLYRGRDTLHVALEERVESGGVDGDESREASAGVGKRKEVLSRGNPEGIRFLPLSQLDDIPRAKRPSAVVRTAGLLLAACGESERAREITVAGRTHGVLTECALRTLQRLPRRATHRQWLAAILRSLPPVSQTPRLIGKATMWDEPIFGG